MPVRTRACSTCRKKRIKCDGTLPHCLMCSRFGKLCPGPLQGPLIVDMTAKAGTGMKRRCTSGQAQIGVAHTTQLDQISRDAVQSIVMEAFYANVLTYFTAKGEGDDIQNQMTWLQHLPGSVTDSSNIALILALKATAVAYGAIVSSQTALNNHARELYSMALRSHHDLLQRSGSKRDITIHTVSTSVLLSFFEAMQATTPDAYRSHIYGAARLLEVTGPGECAQGVLCQLFYHVRTQMLFVQVASHDSDIPISAKRILYDTLLYKDPPLIQRLMCCIAALLDLRATRTCTEEQEEAQRDFLRLQLEQLWKEHSQHIRNDLFDDAFTAMTAAYFSSANIILATRCSGGQYETNLNHDIQVILDATTYSETDRNPIAFMRMATPLLLVALHGPCHNHRKSAIDMFEAWSAKSMRGISALALKAVRGQVGKSMPYAGL